MVSFGENQQVTLGRRGREEELGSEEGTGSFTVSPLLRLPCLPWRRPPIRSPPGSVACSGRSRTLRTSSKRSVAPRCLWWAGTVGKGPSIAVAEIRVPALCSLTAPHGAWYTGVVSAPCCRRLLCFPRGSSPPHRHVSLFLEYFAAVEAEDVDGPMVSFKLTILSHKPTRPHFVKGATQSEQSTRSRLVFVFRRRYRADP
jgi:hypothetical protein